jgi:GTP cyclohydrolase-4
MSPAKDVHAERPDHGRLRLRSVGLSGIRKPLAVRRGGVEHPLAVTFRVAVDLPAERKGSDLSRNAEILAEVVDDTAARPTDSLEATCSQIARELLRRHPSATEATVAASAEYFLSKGVSEAKRSYEDYTLIAEARAVRPAGSSVRVDRSVGAEAVGMTACPCAMETCRAELLKEFPLLGDPRLADLPIVSHNQRNRTRLVFELGEAATVEVDEMIDAIEAAQSSPTFAILKREDEARVVIDAHRRPKFVEDVLRDLLASLPTRFPSLTDEVGVDASTVSEESIHKYNVEAAHRTTFGELKGHPTA